MSSDKKSQEWLKEFESFLTAEEVIPPRSASYAVLSAVRADLNPSWKQVSTKLWGLHALGAGMVSLFCPQLGVGPLIGGHGIMHFFMQYGPLACAALCGALFLGLSTLLAALFLNKEELRLASRYRFLHVTLLASISFAGLMLAGGRSAQLDYTFWIAGAIASGWLMLTIGSSLRLRNKFTFGIR